MFLYPQALRLSVSQQCFLPNSKTKLNIGRRSFPVAAARSAINCILDVNNYSQTGVIGWNRALDCT